MFKRDWLRWTSALAFQAIAILLIANVAIMTYQGFLSARMNYQDDTERRRGETEKAARKIGRECGVAELSALRIGKCISEKTQAYLQQSNTNQDLQAQQDMAYWAQALFWLTLFGSIVSVCGLIALLVSLRQTRTAISDTREIGEAQVRAYVALEVGTRKMRLTSFGAGSVPAAEFLMKNSGNSPAPNMRYVAGIQCAGLNFPEHNGEILKPIANGAIPSDVVSPGEGSFGEAFGSEVLTETAMNSITGPSPTSGLYLLGIIMYRDVFGVERVTRFGLRLHLIGKSVTSEGERWDYGWKTTANHNDAT